MKHIVLFSLLLCTAHAQQAALKPATGKRVALVIGNNRYSSSPLENCVGDAAAIARLLREQLSFDVVLADKDSENLSRLAFTRRLQAFQAEAQNAEIALFYYAGHGMEDFDGRDNYLIPVDADLAEAAKDNAGLQAQGISLELVLKSMRTATSGAKIILLDCCRERPADRAIRTHDGGGLAMPTDAHLPQDTLIMLAASPARPASDGNLGHGPFTAALLKHLPTPGTALHQIFRTVRNEVLATTNQQQKPWLKLDGAGDFFYDHALSNRLKGTVETPVSTSLDGIFVNSMGMRFVPVLGTEALFSIWETRSMDYAIFDAERPRGQNSKTGTWKTATVNGVAVGRGENESADRSAHPVVFVSHADATTFCEWLTRREQAAGLLKKNQEYRLPTDLEWSFAVGIGNREIAITPAARAAQNLDVFPWAGEYPPPWMTGNYADETARRRGVNPSGIIEGYQDGHATTAPVGSYSPNSFGIYDLGGNVWEWTSDFWEPGNTDWVLRGGSWSSISKSLVTSSARNGNPSTHRNQSSGFRCVLAPKNSR